jgi:hypothetical protein
LQPLSPDTVVPSNSAVTVTSADAAPTTRGPLSTQWVPTSGVGVDADVALAATGLESAALTTTAATAR